MAARAEAEERVRLICLAAIARCFLQRLPQNFNRQLRAEQDADYEASLRADQEKAQAQAELQRAAAQQHAEREAAEAAEAAAVAQAERAAQEQAAQLAARRAAKASALSPEPPMAPGVNQVSVGWVPSPPLGCRF